MVMAPAVVVDDDTELIVGTASWVVACADEDVDEVLLAYAALDELAVIWT